MLCQARRRAKLFVSISLRFSALHISTHVLECLAVMHDCPVALTHSRVALFKSCCSLLLRVYLDFKS